MAIGTEAAGCLRRVAPTARDCGNRRSPAGGWRECGGAD